MDDDDLLLLVVAEGDDPLFIDDGTSVSWGIKPKELKPDSGVAEEDEGVDAVCCSKYVEFPPALELELLFVDDVGVDDCCW